MLIIDSSSITKYLSREPGWEDVVPYISEACTISLALTEVGNALLRKSRKGEISEGKAEEIIAAYSSSAILVEQNACIQAAFRIAIDNGMSMYDSLFLAVAMDRGYDLVSSDRKQLEKAKELGIKSFSV